MARRLTARPTGDPLVEQKPRFERFYLSENPFPSEPTVNKTSTDKRINGHIFEDALREHELKRIEEHFLTVPQTDLNHIRLGYMIDASYIGRGNGKSAFCLNLHNRINKEYCLDISRDINKCFCIYVMPEPGGRTKTFAAFVDLLFEGIVETTLLTEALTILRLNGIHEAYPTFSNFPDDEESLIRSLQDEDWYRSNELDLAKIRTAMTGSSSLRDLPQEFPVQDEFSSRRFLTSRFTEPDDFVNYYRRLKTLRDKIEFVFSHLVRFFIAASFNGAYVLVDDFERIPDFQSGRQKRDFALELRSVLFDGACANARTGFFNFILVLHAGVPRLIDEAWQQSGLNTRSPILDPNKSGNHVIPFEKLTEKHVGLLLQKYLSEYRLPEFPQRLGNAYPFTLDAIRAIGDLNEYNAARILKTAYLLMERASVDPNQDRIDEDFVKQMRDPNLDVQERDEQNAFSGGENLMSRIKEEG